MRRLQRQLPSSKSIQARAQISAQIKEQAFMLEQQTEAEYEARRDGTEATVKAEHAYTNAAPPKGHRRTVSKPPPNCRLRFMQTKTARAAGRDGSGRQLECEICREHSSIRPKKRSPWQTHWRAPSTFSTGFRSHIRSFCIFISPYEQGKTAWTPRRAGDPVQIRLGYTLDHIGRRHTA